MKTVALLCQTAIPAALLSWALVLPGSANAQAGFVREGLLSSLCLAQNWDTPSIQAQLRQMKRRKRLELFSALPLAMGERRCLMRKKPVSVAVCDRFAQMLLGDARSSSRTADDGGDAALGGFSASGCLEKNPGADDDWLPPDLAPDPAVTAILERARRGERKAQAAAVALYTDGKELPANERKASYWLEKAAQAGDADSQIALGWRYSIGKGLQEVNFSKALHYLTLAAQQGQRDAMALLASVYAQDEPHYGQSKMRSNPAKSISWYVKAAEAGHAGAALMLGRIHEEGRSVPVDLAKSFSWYQKAAHLNSAPAMLKLSEFLQLGKAVARDARLAQAWRRKADALGENAHTRHLKDYFPWGEMPAMPEEAAAAQLEHARAGDVDAQLAVASRLLEGLGLQKDPEQAASWWRKAAQAGDPIGQRMLGDFLLDGAPAGGRRSEREAVQWLEKAAAQGDTAASVLLAYRLVQGRAARDAQEARRHTLDAARMLREAAERGYDPQSSRDRAQSWLDSLSEQ